MREPSKSKWFTTCLLRSSSPWPPGTEACGHGTPASARPLPCLLVQAVRWQIWQLVRKLASFNQKSNSLMIFLHRSLEVTREQAPFTSRRYCCRSPCWRQRICVLAAVQIPSWDTWWFRETRGDQILLCRTCSISQGLRDPCAVEGLHSPAARELHQQHLMSLMGQKPTRYWGQG